MTANIRTNKSWQRHLPKRPKKARRTYYSEPKKIGKKTIIRIIYLIIAILLIQSIFQIKYLKIEKIDLTGNEDLVQEELADFIYQEIQKPKYIFFEYSNYFFVPTEDLENKLLTKYNLDQVQVSKKWPDILQVDLVEKSSHFIWQKDDSIYLLDAKGRLNRQISVLDDKYLLLDDKRDYKPAGEQIFNQEEIDIINQIYLDWMELIASKAKLHKINIYNNWVLELNTEMGFYVKINKDQDIYEQLNNLRAVLEENIAGVDIDYIDVRFGDKVYFK